MDQKLHKVEFGTASISKFTGIHPTTVALHCRTGRLKAYRKGAKGDYHILAEDFAEYLRHHPAALKHYRKMKLNGFNLIVQTYILEQLKDCPKYFSVQEVANIFGVTRKTVWNWVRTYGFEPDLYENDRKTFKAYFLAKNVNSLLAQVPRIRNIYTSYNEKRKIN